MQNEAMTFNFLFAKATSSSHHVCVQVCTCIYIYIYELIHIHILKVTCGGQQAHKYCLFKHQVDRHSPPSPGVTSYIDVSDHNLKLSVGILEVYDI